MRQYLEAVRQVLERGTRKENRTKVDTLSTFGLQRVETTQHMPIPFRFEVWNREVQS